MLLALATAVVAISLGAIAALVAHERLWALAPLRAFAVIAVAGSVALHLLPETINAAGWPVLLACALGFFAPPLISRAVAAVAAGRGHRRLAIELGYAGVLLHQVGDGLGLGAMTRDNHVDWAFLIGVVAHSVPLVAVWMGYRVGSSDEGDGDSGFAHLFEHMFKNSLNLRGRHHYELLREVGATDANAQTGTDRTVYHEVMPRAALDTALWIEADRMAFFLPGLDEARRDLPHRRGEHRVGEHEAVVDLHERRGVADPEHREAGVGARGLRDAAGHPAHRGDQRGGVAEHHPEAAQRLRAAGEGQRERREQRPRAEPRAGTRR